MLKLCDDAAVTKPQRGVSTALSASVDVVIVLYRRSYVTYIAFFGA